MSTKNTLELRYGRMNLEEVKALSRSTWDLVHQAVAHADKVLLWGPPGTGKTTAGMKHALEGREALKITAHEEMSAAEIQGHYMPEGNSFKWHDGLGIRAWKEGNRLVVDEIDRASGDVATMMYAIADDPDVAALTLPTNETVRPEKGFQLVATMNGHPMDLPPALRDRFDVAVEVLVPPLSVLESFPEKYRAIAEKDIFSYETDATLRRWKTFLKLNDRMEERAAIDLVFNKDLAKQIKAALATTEV